jgi:hypothetical protein
MALDNVMRRSPEKADPWIKRVEAQTLAAASEGLTHAPYRVSQKSHAEMINRWAAVDEDAAFAYLDSAPQIAAEDREAILRKALDRLQTNDPEKAAYYLLKRWKDADQPNAVDFVATLPQKHWDVSVSNLKSHYKIVAQAWGQSDPRTAGYYVGQQEALDPKETAELLVALQPFEN